MSLDIKITDKGIEVPVVSEMIPDLWDIFKNAFGSDLNTEMSTPQGQLVTSLAAILSDKNNQLVNVINQFDPIYAQGIWQEALGHIYLMSRKKATHSTAQLTAIGLVGVSIPKGFRFLDQNSNSWVTTEQNIIEQNGEAVINVQAVDSGVIEASANTITTIVKALSGLDRVTNNHAAVVGSEEESQRDFEARRRESVALNSKNTNSATFGAVANLKDVVDVYVYDNPSDETIQIGSTNYPLIRNSILVSVVGGDSERIAKTILTKAGSGCSFNGNTEVIVKDTENFPYAPPTYAVKFERPKHIPINVKVILENKQLMSLEDEQKIKNTIVESSLSGNAKAHIGQAVIASKLICPVSNAVPNLTIVSIQVSKDGQTYSNSVDVGVDEYPITSLELIEVT